MESRSGTNPSLGAINEITESIGQDLRGEFCAKNGARFDSYKADDFEQAAMQGAARALELVDSTIRQSDSDIVFNWRVIARMPLKG